MPGRSAVHARISGIMKVAGSASYVALHRAWENLLVLKSAPDKQQDNGYK